MKPLFLLIDYDNIGDNFWIGGNIKFERVSNIVEAFLSNQVGKGIDKSPSNENDLFCIDISVDLTDDTLECRHNCGNKSLREGILLHLLGRLKKIDPNIIINELRR